MKPLKPTLLGVLAATLATFPAHAVACLSAEDAAWLGRGQTGAPGISLRQAHVVDYKDDAVGSVLYFGFRFYHPQLGRWTSRDPIGEGGGLNIFAFTSNRATNAFDSLGREPGYPGPSEVPEYSPQPNLTYRYGGWEVTIGQGSGFFDRAAHVVTYALPQKCMACCSRWAITRKAKKLYYLLLDDESANNPTATEGQFGITRNGDVVTVPAYASTDAPGLRLGIQNFIPWWAHCEWTATCSQGAWANQKISTLRLDLKCFRDYSYVDGQSSWKHLWELCPE